MVMNKTYRYFNGQTDVTDFFTGHAVEESEGKWLLTLSQGGIVVLTGERKHIGLFFLDVYHIAMMETDYSTYAAYVECNEDNTKNFPVISSTNLSGISDEKVGEIYLQIFLSIFYQFFSFIAG